MLRQLGLPRQSGCEGVGGNVQKGRTWPLQGTAIGLEGIA